MLLYIHDADNRPFLFSPTNAAVSRAVVDPGLNRLCQAQVTCADCIRESPDCGWCSDTVSLHAINGQRFQRFFEGRLFVLYTV